MKETPKTDSPSPSQIRKHYFLERYCIIAPKRGYRPGVHDSTTPEEQPKCAFCNNTELSLWQSPNDTPWRVKVIRNAFPALTVDNPSAFGAHEVVIDTPKHHVPFSELPIAHIEHIFAAYESRLESLSSIKGVRYVLVFKNSGAAAGATIHHAHSQILALPLIPPKIEQEADALNHYWDKHNSCAYCDLLTWEMEQKERIIAEDKHFVSIAPYASENAYEAWLIPKHHRNYLSSLNAPEKHSLARLLKQITQRLQEDNIAYNYFLQESLRGQNHHFVLKVEPRTTKWAGAELGTGIIINPIPPEETIRWYNTARN